MNTVPSLAELQSGFARALRDPGLPAPRDLRSGRGSEPGRRFDVHRNNMMASLVDALRSAFPAVHRLVGEDYFAAVGRAYVERHPPDSPVLLWYGEAFPGFLESLPSASGVPYLGDVARLEWARVDALHAADAESASIADLAGVPEALLESVMLPLHPSLWVIRSRWPIVSLWSACRDEDHAGQVDMGTPEHAVVVRPALQVGVHVPPPGGAEFLDALRGGVPLGGAARRAMAAQERFDLAAQLQFVFGIGAVTTVKVPQQENQP